MPADFERCIANNGKVITKRLNKDEYVKLCKDEAGWHKGETHKYKKLTRHSKAQKA